MYRFACNPIDTRNEVQGHQRIEKIGRGVEI
jgi:hypothetical protein